MKCLAAFLGGAASYMLPWNSALFYILHLTPWYSNCIVLFHRFYWGISIARLQPVSRLTNVIDRLVAGNYNFVSEIRIVITDIIPI